MSNVIYAEFCGQPTQVRIAFWSLQSLTASIHDSNPGDFGYPYKVEAVFHIDAKEYASIKRKGALGQLFGIDLSNDIYRLNNNIPASNPSVDNSKPARHGIKVLRLTYYFRDHERAAKLGFEQFKFKNGQIVPKYGQRIDLLARGAK